MPKISSLIRKNFIFAVVFFTGSAVLIIEVTATRILSPFFGNTIFTVSSVIGVVLGALSLGYYWGGIISDKYPKYEIFFLLIVASGFFTLYIFFSTKSLLSQPGIIFDLIWGPIILSINLFFLPNLFLGALSPFAIKLLTTENNKIGSVAGKVFFWSTLGSIFGSFFTGFYLIPRFGILRIIFFTAFFLVFLGISGLLFSLKEKKKINFSLFLCFIFLFFFLVGIIPEKKRTSPLIFYQEGLYNPIFIQDIAKEEKRVRLLRFDFILAQSAIFLDSEELVAPYLHYSLLYKIFNPEAKNVLFIGGGAYTLPRFFLLREKNFQSVEVVEIEPSLFSLAKKYFQFPEDPRFTNHIADGRRFLLQTSNVYDFIFFDAYSFGIPQHLATKEFFELSKNRLSENGIFIMNIVGSLKKGADLLLLSVVKTFCLVFENCSLIATISPPSEEIQNFILFASKNKEIKIDHQDKKFLETEDSFIKEVPQKIVDLSKLDFSQVPILTDDFCPLDYYVAQMIRKGEFPRN